MGAKTGDALHEAVRQLKRDAFFGACRSGVFTEVTITTPPLTRVFDRLIGGGISLCGNRV